MDHPKLDGPTVCPSNWKEGFIMKSVRNALNRRAKGEKGFTLVELLVVVINRHPCRRGHPDLPEPAQGRLELRHRVGR